MWDGNRITECGTVPAFDYSEKKYTKLERQSDKGGEEDNKNLAGLWDWNQEVLTVASVLTIIPCTVI